MNAKSIFSSVSLGLEAVERELRLQAERIMVTWSRDGERAEHVEVAVRHLLHNPGKLLRPALVLLSSGLADPRLLERLDGVLIRLATAVELIHSASLVHDDIIDGEKVRRGKPALHYLYGNQTAVLVGDILYSESFNLLARLELADGDRHRELLALISATTRDMCIGEIVEQRVLEEGTTLAPPEYLEILRQKTAVLMSTCCAGAAIACGAGAETSARLSEFGLDFGLAFQLLDDQRDGDAPVGPEVDLAAEAERYLLKAQGILETFPESPYRRELEGACAFIAAGVAAPG